MDEIITPILMEISIKIFPGLKPIDYLIIGPITKDLSPQGAHIGGTAAYAARTAQAIYIN